MPFRNQGKNIRMTVNHLTVSYIDEGPTDAPVIIFIHGFPFNKSMWDTQVDALKSTYRVIAYDVRGHGDSEAGEEEFTIELFASDLVSLMNLLKIERAVLCGLSMGGYIALNAAVNFPDHFAALVLSDTQCAADTPEGREKRMKTIQSIKDNGLEQYADESVKKMFAPDAFATRTAEIKAVRQMILRTSAQTLYNTLVALSIRKETCSRLARIKIPVLIMAGKEDQITPPALAQVMHEKIPHSSLAIIEHAGHIANMENPMDFNQQLTTFLTGLAEKPHRPPASVDN